MKVAMHLFRRRTPCKQVNVRHIKFRLFLERGGVSNSAVFVCTMSLSLFVIAYAHIVNCLVNSLSKCNSRRNSATPVPKNIFVVRAMSSVSFGKFQPNSVDLTNTFCVFCFSYHFVSRHQVQGLKQHLQCTIPFRR